MLQESSCHASIADWVQLIRSEFLEIPGLHLTLAQARRLWGLDDTTSAAILSALVDARFLKQTATGAYVLASGR